MRYKIALIGCGRIGIWLEDDPLRPKPASHLGGINKINEDKKNNISVQLTALCDINPQRLEKCRIRWQNLIKPHQYYLDYKELIRKEKPDIIIIATWTSTHRDIAVYAAYNGVKGIVLEKPAASTLKQAKEIIEACKKFNAKVVVNHERRWGPRYIKTREIIENNTLGDIKLLYGNVLSQSAPRGPWQSILTEFGGGPLLHDGTHLIDMIRYFAGDIIRVNGCVKRDAPDFGTETTATAMLETKNGIPVFIEAGGMRNYFNFEIDLQFERGRIKIGNGINEYFVSQESNRYTGFNDLVPSTFPDHRIDSNPFTGAILELIRSIEQNTVPQSSGYDGYKAMEVIFAIYQSAYLNGKTLNLPLKINHHPLKKMFKKELI